MADVSLNIKGMTCASCVARVEKIAGKISGIENISVNLATEKLNFTTPEPDKVIPPLAERLTDYGYEIVSQYSNEIKEDKSAGNQGFSFEFKLALVLTIPIFIISMLLHFEFFKFLWPFNQEITNKILLVLTTPIMFISGKDFFRLAYKNALHFSTDMNTLVAVGSGAAYVFSVYNTLFLNTNLKDNLGDQIYFETAAVIITLILYGRNLEARAKSKTSSALKNLLKLTPQECTIIENGEQKIIPTKSLIRGQTVIVKPGENIPADGIIVSGNTSIDESMITGESIPIDKSENDRVTGGTINLIGSFKFKVTELGKESFLGRVIELIENAQASKPPIQRLADKIAGVFIQVVIIIAILTWIGWFFFVTEYEMNTALVNFVAVLIVACPCALGLATPTAILVGTGLGASNGILIKDAESLENLYRSKTVVFDKTGTITKGEPTVKDFISFSPDRKSVLKLAASLESSSEHPYAKAINNYAQAENIKISEVELFEYLIGSGIKGRVDGNNITIGSRELFSPDKLKDLKLADQNLGKKIFIEINGKIQGYFRIDDQLRDDAKMGIDKLHSLGIKTVLLTGDERTKAAEISASIGTTEYISDVKPDEKAAHIKKLQGTDGIIAMVGDGINDAPALKQADVGIAMGAGTDIAIDSAKIILINNRVLDTVKAFLLSKKTTATIKQNLFWAFIYNSVGIPLAVLGMLNPMIAAVAMAFSSVSVVSNSLRLRRIKLDV